MLNPDSTNRELHLPLLATNSRGELFEYILLSINPLSALIEMPSWLTHRIFLEEEGWVNLHLKKCLSENYEMNEKIEGSVSRLGGGGDLRSRYRITFIPSLQFQGTPRPPRSMEELKELLLGTIKDSVLLKNGVYIYLKHLIPYLSRTILTNPHRYRALRDHILDDVRDKVSVHLHGLEELYSSLQRYFSQKVGTPFEFNLPHFQLLTLSEIDEMLFQVALDPPELVLRHASHHDPLANPHLTQQHHLRYVDAIKLTELRLYDNYNRVVATYAAMVAQEGDQG